MTWPRVRRTKIGVAETPIAIIALVRLGPRNAAIAIARIRNGQARKASVMREISASTAPPMKPAARPIGTPSSSEIETETTPASSDARVPQTTRERTSRPMSSVPNQCVADGAWRRLRRRRSAMAGLVVVCAFVTAALLAPWLAPFDPIETSWSAIRKAPSAAHWFGTDEVGRDVFSRIVWGTRASLLAGVVAVSIAVALGVPIGMTAGLVGGFVDALISRVTDAFLACPFLILAIALAAFLGPSLTNAMIAIGVSATPIFVRLTRGQVLNVKVEEYIEAARALGNSPFRIAWRHVLPNILAPVIVQSTLAIAAAIIAEASLSFLGLGQQPPAPSWGSMLNTAKNYVDNAPWMAIWPGLAIFLLVLSFNLLGDGLRDALDPRQR